jgi:hypothetical protein
MRSEADLFEALRSIDLPPGDFAVFGSGPLIIRGIIEATNDLDVISRGAAWDHACQVGAVAFVPEYGVDIVTCLEGAITVGRSWGYGTFDIDQLIDTAEIIEGLPFVRIEHVIAYKRIADRAKDRAHLRLLEEADLPGLEQGPSRNTHS